jgi:hypothetical protein
LAKKPKAAGLPLSKLIADIAEGDETTKFELIKEETVGLMNCVTAECMAKLACLAVAEQEEEDCIDAEETNDLPLELHDPTQQNARDNDVDEPNEPNKANENVHEPNGTNEPNEANNNQPHQHHMNTRATIADQELELPNSHTVISRSRLSRLGESDKLGQKLKAKIRKAKQHRSSHLGRRHCNSALHQAPRLSTHMAEQTFPMIIAGFLADAEMTFDAEAIASSCPSAETSNYFVVDGSIDSMLWLEDQFQAAAATFIARDKGKRQGIDHFPKAMSWWSTTDAKVCSACIDADGSGGTSDECARAIWHSIKTFRGAPPFFYGQTTDSGGGGVLHSLQRSMARLLLCARICFIAPCALHGQLKLCLAKAVQTAGM